MKHKFLNAFVIALILFQAMAPIGALAWVGTDQEDYSPGSVVTISGDNSDNAGYVDGETVHVDVTGPNGYSATCEGTADANGAWSCQVTLWNSLDAVGDYAYTATGLTSGVSQSGTFTDAVRNINFATSGLPAGVSITVSGSRTNNGGNVAPFSATFTSPGPSSPNIGTLDGTTMSYSGFPASVTASGQNCTLTSTSPASPFTTPSGAGITTVTATYSCVAANTAPVASAVSISGTAQYGELLTGIYTYSDDDGDAQGASTFRWLRNGTTVVGTNQTYTTVSADIGQTLTFEVTPVAATGTSPGTAVQSSAVSIGKASSTTTISCPSNVTFTGSPLTPCTATATGAGGLSASVAVVYGNNTNAGTATADATYAGDSNHEGSTATQVTFTIDKASSTTTVTCPASVVYTGSAQTPCTASVTGAGGLSQSLTVNYSNNINPGANTAVASATFGGDANHTGSSDSKNFSILYATGGMCYGGPGHQILQPINVDGSSVFKQKSTVPAKFRVCDVYGNSIGTPGVVDSFRLIQVITGTTVTGVNEPVDSTTPDTAFRWSATDQQWIFNINTKNMSANKTYVYLITLDDGSTIEFRFGLK